MKQRALFFAGLFFCLLNSECFACFPGPEASVLLSANSAIFHQYGVMSVSFGALAACLRLGRGHIVKWETAVFLVPFIYISTCFLMGFQRGINCGISSAEGSVLNAQIGGALLLWQAVALALCLVRRRTLGISRSPKLVRHP